MVVRSVLLLGSRKSSTTPTSAATADGTLAVTEATSGWSVPSTSASRPGPIQSTIVTLNAMTALISPRRQGPSARLRSAMICSTPGISRTPVRPTQLR